jgi:hypothetical protein
MKGKTRMLTSIGIIIALYTMTRYIETYETAEKTSFKVWIGVVFFITIFCLISILVTSNKTLS